MHLAYTDSIFNLGAGAFEGSSLRHKLNAVNRPEACAELLRWDQETVGGKPVTLPGLTKRRKAEYQRCLGKRAFRRAPFRVAQPARETPNASYVAAEQTRQSAKAAPPGHSR
ncbi:glycoside hydrolase family protein [Ralstonia solanacearum]|uniref:glycoside hydrolase family protein n=1 Tax=Ralstonia solanacearum TaxID=305 RepID=UPI0035E56FE8